MLKISVVIPVFNQQDYVADAIDSVLDQTVKPHEIIVVDDGSTDHSGDIADGYKVKVIHQVNKGLASARNTGIMNATGDYVFFLDADDILLESCLEKIQEVAEKSKVDVIAPSFRSFGVQSGEVILSQIPTLKEFTTANRLPYFCAIKRSVLLEVGGYSPRMTYGYEDYHLWFDLFKRGHSLAVIPEVLVLYRTKEESMYTDAVKHHDELMRQIIKDHHVVFDS